MTRYSVQPGERIFVKRYRQGAENSKYVILAPARGVKVL